MLRARFPKVVVGYKKTVVKYVATIGANTTIAARAVVAKDMPPPCTDGGSAREADWMGV